MTRLTKSDATSAETERQSSGSAQPSAFKYIQSLERGLAIITSFNEKNPELTLADVARATGLDRSTARRFLLTLQALGYVVQRGLYFRLFELQYAAMATGDRLVAG